FYAEMGGQVADHGTLTTDKAVLKVLDVKKTPKGYFVHTCVLESGLIKVGDKVNAQVDKSYHMDIARNHTATHLMQAALREVLGDHVHQAGSYQDAGVTHFDFTHFSAVTAEELRKVEEIVNEKIWEGMTVEVRNMPIAEAKQLGAMALFGEKYGEVVRVVNVEGWSTEFCGGSHVQNTAQIGCFKIISESSVAAGTRRIEAVTGRNAVALMQENEAALKLVAATLKTGVKDVPARVEGMANENKALTKEVADLKAAAAAAKANSLFDNAVNVDGVRVVASRVAGDSNALRSMCDTARDKAPDAVAVLAAVDGEKMSLAVAVGKDAQARGLKAGMLVKEIAAIAGGKGGGKPDFAMAGLKDASKIDAALAAAVEIVKSQMK
ncbi:MAG: alanine--tRNA ligase, partial [Faecalibacterium sp.]|nr:alanine--tRNA ligase [Faecalibacterium sp.]